MQWINPNITKNPGLMVLTMLSFLYHHYAFLSFFFFLGITEKAYLNSLFWGALRALSFHRPLFIMIVRVRCSVSGLCSPSDIIVLTR